LLAVGVALFRVLMPTRFGLYTVLPSAIRRLSIAALIAHLLLSGADGASRAGLGLAGLFAIDAWRAAYDTPTVWLQAITLIGLLLLIMTRSTFSQSIGALLSLATLAATGHVLAVLPDGIGQVLMVGHGLVAALWIGAIGPLRMALASDAGPTTAVLFRRFQSYGAVAVLGVLASGTTMAWLLLPRLSDLWLSDYGLRLFAKLAAVGVMLFIALINRAWLTRAALAGSSRMRQRLVTILRLDLVVAILAVVLAAGLSLGPPPLPSLQIILPGGPYAIQLTLSPGKVGDNSAEIVLLPSQAAAEPKGVDLRILAPETGIEATVYEAHPVAPGRYRVTGLPLWMGGRWQMQVGVLVDDFTKLHWETTVNLEQ
jgi:copper transport protein